MRLQRHHLNTLIYLGVSLVSKSASLILIPLYTKKLTPAEYGAYGLCQTFYWIAPPLFSLALASAVSRFFFDYSDAEKRDSTVGTLAGALALLSIAGALLTEVAIDLFPVLRPDALSPLQMRLVIWTAACIPLAEVPAVYLRASERALQFAVYSLTVFAVTISSTALFLLHFDLKLTGLLLGMLCGQVLGAALSAVFVMVALKPRRDLALIRAAARYSIPFIPHMVGNALLIGTDRWALEYFNLRDDLGLYTLATQLTLPIQLVTGAWNEASSPRFFAACRDGGPAAGRKLLPRIAGGFVGGALVTLVAILCALPLLKLFIGARFQQAFPLVPWIGLSLTVGLVFSAFVSAFEYRKATRVIPFFTLGAVALNFALNFVLVPRYGVYGAILATGLAYLARTLILAAGAARMLRD